MDLEKKIHNCLGFLLDSHKDLIEWDGDGFIDNKDLAILKSLVNRHPSKWTAKMAFNGWKVLEKYQNDLEDCDVQFSDLKKPDYIEEDKITPEDKNIINIIKNQFVILNPCEIVQKTFETKNSKEIKSDFNLNNLYKIYPLIQNNNLKINKEYFKFINMFLNILKVEDMFDGFSPDSKRNFNFELKPFQAIGCLFMLFNKRIILGDDMGLGKTIQAIASIEISGKKPCLIICPNNLKLNWASEVLNNVKNQKVEFINKKSTLNSDFYIINYESLHKNLDFISKIKPVSVIMDESHYLKNQNAKRTKSCMEAINNIEYRFALTGTAILKSPVDLISQLRILNKLDSFGSECDFIEAFCGNSTTKWGKDIRKGASNLTVLNRMLRENCFLRREKSNVIKDLPEKTRSYIHMEINSKKYKELSKEFSTLKRFQKLEKIEKLRQLAANEKLDSVKEWINNFSESDKKLVVFAYHTEIQKKLLEAYPNAASIVSGMSDKDKDDNKNRFMNEDDCKLIICSLKSASVGLTLTAASDVLFTEMDWCAANNNQAEDRCHRIGQKNAVNIWYIIAKNTIEEYIQEVVEKKRTLIDNIYNSKNDNESIANQIELLQISIIDEVIEKLDNKEEKTKAA